MELHLKEHNAHDYARTGGASNTRMRIHAQSAPRIYDQTTPERFPATTHFTIDA